MYTDNNTSKVMTRIVIIFVTIVFFQICTSYINKRKNQNNKKKSSERKQDFDQLEKIQDILISHLRSLGKGNLTRTTISLNIKDLNEFTLYSYLVQAIYGNEVGIGKICGKDFINGVLIKISEDDYFRNKICSELYGISIGIIISVLSSELNKKVDFLEIQNYLKMFDGFNQKALVRGYILSFKAHEKFFEKERIESLRYYQDMFGDLILNKINNHQDYPDPLQSRMIDSSFFLSFAATMETYKKHDPSLRGVLSTIYREYEKNGIFKQKEN